MSTKLANLTTAQLHDVNTWLKKYFGSGHELRDKLEENPAYLSQFEDLFDLPPSEEQELMMIQTAGMLVPNVGLAGVERFIREYMAELILYATGHKRRSELVLISADIANALFEPFLQGEKIRPNYTNYWKLVNREIEAEALEQLFNDSEG